MTIFSARFIRRMSLAIIVSPTLFGVSAYADNSEAEELAPPPAKIQAAATSESPNPPSSSIMQLWNAAPLSPDEIVKLYAQANWVSYVRVTQVQHRVNVALSSPQMYALDGIVYNLAVLNQWKGDGDSVAQLEVADKDCAAMLEEAGEYIVFATGSSQALVSNQCAQLVPFQPNSQAIAVLNDLYRQSFVIVNTAANDSAAKLP